MQVDLKKQKTDIIKKDNYSFDTSQPAHLDLKKTPQPCNLTLTEISFDFLQNYSQQCSSQEQRSQYSEIDHSIRDPII